MSGVPQGNAAQLHNAPHPSSSAALPQGITPPSASPGGQHQPPSSTSRWTIHVRNAERGVLYHLVFDGSAAKLTGMQLKRYLEGVSQVPVSQQYILCGDHVLGNEDTGKTLGLSDGDTLVMFSQPPPGFAAEAAFDGTGTTAAITPGRNAEGTYSTATLCEPALTSTRTPGRQQRRAGAELSPGGEAPGQRRSSASPRGVRFKRSQPNRASEELASPQQTPPARQRSQQAIVEEVVGPRLVHPYSRDDEQSAGGEAEATDSRRHSSQGNQKRGARFHASPRPHEGLPPQQEEHFPSSTQHFYEDPLIQLAPGGDAQLRGSAADPYNGSVRGAQRQVSPEVERGHDKPSTRTPAPSAARAASRHTTAAVRAPSVSRRTIYGADWEDEGEPHVPRYVSVGSGTELPYSTSGPEGGRGSGGLNHSLSPLGFYADASPRLPLDRPSPHLPDEKKNLSASPLSPHELLDWVSERDHQWRMEQHRFYTEREFYWKDLKTQEDELRFEREHIAREREVLQHQIEIARQKRRALQQLIHDDLQLGMSRQAEAAQLLPLSPPTMPSHAPTTKSSMRAGGGPRGMPTGRESVAGSGEAERHGWKPTYDPARNDSELHQEAVGYAGGPDPSDGVPRQANRGWEPVAEGYYPSFHSSAAAYDSHLPQDVFLSQKPQPPPQASSSMWSPDAAVRQTMPLRTHELRSGTYAAPSAAPPGGYPVYAAGGGGGGVGAVPRTPSGLFS